MGLSTNIELYGGWGGGHEIARVTAVLYCEGSRDHIFGDLVRFISSTRI